MSRIADIFAYMRTCPQLTELWSIGAVEDIGVNVIFPQGSSQAYRIEESKDVVDGYSFDMIPLPSVYEDYQINCYEYYDQNDSTSPSANINVLSYESVQNICEWVAEQNENGNLPNIQGETVLSIEVNPFVPQIRYVNAEENVIAYFVTIRIRYLNNRKPRSVYHA